MNDLRQYLSLKSKIEELEKKVAKLNRLNSKLELKCKQIQDTRTSKVRSEISRIKSKKSSKDITETIKYLSDRYNLKERDVLDLWYE